MFVGTSILNLWRTICHHSLFFVPCGPPLMLLAPLPLRVRGQPPFVLCWRGQCIIVMDAIHFVLPLTNFGLFKFFEVSYWYQPPLYPLLRWWAPSNAEGIANMFHWDGILLLLEFRLPVGGSSLELSWQRISCCNTVQRYCYCSSRPISCLWYQWVPMSSYSNQILPSISGKIFYFYYLLTFVTCSHIFYLLWYFTSQLNSAVAVQSGKNQWWDCIWLFLLLAR